MAIILIKETSGVTYLLLSCFLMFFMIVDDLIKKCCFYQVLFPVLNLLLLCVRLWWRAAAIEDEILSPICRCWFILTHRCPGFYTEEVHNEVNVTETLVTYNTAHSS